MGIPTGTGLMEGAIHRWKNVLWCGAVLTPVLITFLFTVLTWSRCNLPDRHHWVMDWVLLLLQVWPQSLAVEAILDLVNGRKEDWETKRGYIHRSVASLEPFLESLPQLIKTCIYVFFRQKHSEDPSNNPFSEINFYISISISAVASIFGIVRFFKVGPMAFLPQVGPLDGLLTLKSFLTFLMVSLNVVAKILLLALLMFYSLGIYQIFTPYQADGLSMVGTKSQPMCDQLFQIRKCSDASFIIYPFHPMNTSRKQKTMWPTVESRWFRGKLRQQSEGFLVWDNTSWKYGFDRCYYEQRECGPIISLCGSTDEIRMECGDFIKPNTASRILVFTLWIVLNLTPQFLLSSMTLTVTHGFGNFIQILVQFPQLLLSPSFSNIVFGPDTLGLRRTGVSMNRSLSWIAAVLSVCGILASLILLHFCYSSGKEEHVQINFLTFLWKGFVLPGPTPGSSVVRVDIMPPPFLLVLSSLVSTIFLITLLHMDDWILSQTPFLSPLASQVSFLGDDGKLDFQDSTPTHIVGNLYITKL